MVTLEDRMLGRCPPATPQERDDDRRYYRTINARFKGIRRRTRRLVALVRKIARKKRPLRSRFPNNPTLW